MNVFKNILRCLTATAVMFVSATSCLEKYPGDAILEKDAMITLSDAEQTLIGIYASFKSSALYSGYLTYLPDIQSDLVYAVDSMVTSGNGTYVLRTRKSSLFMRLCTLL